MPESSHRVGVLGSGFQATNLATAIVRTEGLQLAAIAGTNPTTTADLASALGASAVADLDALLADDSIELVVVATPNRSHADAAVKILDAGKYAFVEKPLALDAASLEHILASSRLAPHRLIVGHTLRTAPGVRRMLEAIEQGEIGAVLGIEACRTRILTTPLGSTSWKQDPAASGGELLHEIHELDLACLVGGKVSGVAGFAASPLDGSAQPPILHSVIQFESGAVAHHVIASGDHDARWTLTVSGTQASIRADLRDGIVSRLEAGIVTDSWPVFDEANINDALIASSSGRATHNRPGMGASSWMAALAKHEMAEVARILNGAHDSILLRSPMTAVATALAILDADYSKKDAFTASST